MVAEGFCLDVPLQAEVEGKSVSWTERRWLVRSLAFAAARQKKLDERLFDALLKLATLNERKQGKKRLTASELEAAAGAIVKKHRVEGMINFQVQTTTRQRKIRAHGERPAGLVKEQEHSLKLSRCDEAIKEAKREMGWRVYATNQLTLNLTAVVWGYRGQNRLEENWSRMKGRPLGLTPMYLQDESRVVGLVLLLSVALRLLSVVEWAVRKKLKEEEDVLRGLYPGQKGRQTSRPSAKLLLQAFRGIDLVVTERAGRVGVHVTPLTALQQRLLELWELPPDLYQRIVAHFSKPPPI